MAGYDTRRYGNNYNENRPQNRKPGFNQKKRDEDLTPKIHVMLDSNTYVDTAEAVILKLKNGNGLLTTSKIRNLLSMISTLYDEVRRGNRQLNKKEQGQIQYIRLHFAYEAGRDQKVKEFVQAADIMAHIKDIGEDKERFLLFCRYLEALVAFHRFNDGKEFR